MSENSESKNPVLIIPRCNVTKVYHAQKSGIDYLTLTDGVSEFNISAGELDLTKVPKLVPLRVEAEISAFVFGKNQSLKALTFKAVPVA